MGYLQIDQQLFTKINFTYDTTSVLTVENIQVNIIEINFRSEDCERVLFFA